VSRLGAIFFAMAVPVAVNARVPVRTIPWYMAHPAILYPTIEVCHLSASYEDTPDCRNAEAAVDGLWAKQEGRRAGLWATLNDPAYWASNPISRKGAMIECARRLPGDEPVLPFCPAVAKSFSMH
jgi:hypothetical protein